MLGLLREKCIIHNFHTESYGVVEMLLVFQVFRFKYQSGHLLEVFVMFLYVSSSLE
jgi:hypothetical protein